MSSYMPPFKSICFGQTEICIYDTNWFEHYGMKKHKGLFVRFLTKDEAEHWKLHIEK